MSVVDFSGYNYPPTFVFTNRVNIPKEFNIKWYDDNELLKFKDDEFGRLSIIELSKIPYIKYEYFNWDHKGQDQTYKWYYLSSSGNLFYRLYPSGTRVPIISGDYNNFWSSGNISGYLLYGNEGAESYSGIFARDTFVKVDMLNNTTGWINELNLFPMLGKPEFSGLLNNRYKPIRLIIGSERSEIGTEDLIEGKDITNYKQNKFPILDRNYANNIQALQFYFDGKNIITNYDFAVQDLTKATHIQYEYTIDKIKVGAKLYTNQIGQSEYSPIINNYIVKISTQRINK